MNNNKQNPGRDLTRRNFIKSAGAGLLAAEFIMAPANNDGAGVKHPSSIAPVRQLTWYETPSMAPWREQKLLVLENDRVSIALLPERGGRLVRYVDRTTGVNHLFENPESETKLDFWWRNTGGIWDKEGVYPEPNICDLPFAYKVQQAPDYLEVVLDADLGNLRVAKRYRLNFGSTRLALETTYENIGSIPICTFFSHIFSLAPGGSASTEGFVVYPDGDGIVKRPFGSRLPEGPSSVLPSWWMVSNSQQGASLLLTYEPHPLLAERVIGSVGAPKWELAYEYEPAHANAVDLELHTRRHRASPGEALTIRWDMHLIKQASEVEQACAEGCFLPLPQRQTMIQSLTPLIQNSAAVFSDMGEHLLTFPWGFVSLSVPNRIVQKPGQLEAEIRVMRFASDATKNVSSGTLHLRLDRTPSVEFPLTRIGPSMANIRYWRVSSTEFADGSHFLGIAVDGRAIDTLFLVINEKSIAKRIEVAQRKGAELARGARHSADATRISAVASCAMRAEDARRKFIMGPAFEEGGNAAYDVDVDRLPLKLSPHTSPAEIDYILRVLGESEAWIEALVAGRNPFRGLTGLFQKAFYSKIDGSLQPYTIYVPKGYNRTIAWPLLVLLQGSGGSQWEIPQSAANIDGHSPFRGALEKKSPEPNFLLCSALARGPSGFEQVAEVDLLQMLEEVQRDYHVDIDRIYAMGWSMGGAGAFLLASRFPDRFAAVMPIAGSVDSTIIANACYVPCWNFHELGDTNVSPGYTNISTATCRALGMPYHEGILERPFVWSPWSDHSVGYRMSGSFDEIEKILGTYRRVSSPKEVTLTATELRHNHSYGVRIDSFERYYKPASMKAHIEGDIVEIASSNVRSFTLSLTSGQVGTSGFVRVKQNGRIVFEGKPSAELRIGPKVASAGIQKQHGLSGPLSDIFYEPFMVVYGTYGDDKLEIEAGCKQAESIRTEGLRGVRFYSVPVKSERDLTPAEVESFHLLLVGTPKSSLLLDRIQRHLPVRIEGEAVFAGDRRFTGEDIGFRLIYPNPLNRRRYVAVCAAASYRGLEGLASIPSPNYGWTERVMEPDVLITDYRIRSYYPRYLAALTFNNDWQLEDRGPVLGRLEIPLSRLGIECTWGDFRADAVREATGADIALVEVDDHLYPQELPAGEVRRADLNMANNYSPIYMFGAKGAQLRDGLEHMIERFLHGPGVPAVQAPWFGTTRRPVAISGFSYAFNSNHEYGKRVAACSLEPEKLYVVAVTEHVLGQSTKAGGGWGYLGWLPKIKRTAMNEVDAQILYLQRHNPARPNAAGRIMQI